MSAPSVHVFNKQGQKFEIKFLNKKDEPKEGVDKSDLEKSIKVHQGGFDHVTFPARTSAVIYKDGDFVRGGVYRPKADDPSKMELVDLTTKTKHEPTGIGIVINNVARVLQGRPTVFGSSARKKPVESQSLSLQA